MRSITQIHVLTGDERRKSAAKLAKQMPRDAAATLINIISDPDRLRRGDLQPTEHASGKPHLRYQRVLLPLIEPNVLGWGRLRTLGGAWPGALPHPKVAADGVLEVTWDSPAAHDAATRQVVTHYLDTHHGIPALTDRARNSLDSWHEPLTLVPVRHAYRDGCPTQTRWLTADGTARVIAFRQALVEEFTWLTGHPYADPAGHWPADIATWRSFLAAGRAEAERQAQADQAADEDHEPRNPAWYLRQPSLDDWAHIVLPVPGDEDYAWDIELWNLHQHRSAGTAPASGPQAPDGEDTEIADLQELIESVDPWTGRDPYDVFGLDPAVKADREDIRAKEQELQDWLLQRSNRPDEQARRIAAMLIDTFNRETGAEALEGLDTYVTWMVGAPHPALAKTTALRVIRDELTSAFGQPNLSDLYGLYGDLTSGAIPTDDPAQPWWWCAAAIGLTYAATLDYLPYGGEEQRLRFTVRVLLSTDTGRQQVNALAEACQHGRVRVPLVLAGGEGEYLTRDTLTGAVDKLSTAMRDLIERAARD